MRTDLSRASRSPRRSIISLVMVVCVIGCVPTVPDPLETSDDSTSPSSGQVVGPAVVAITVPVEIDGGGIVAQDLNNGFVRLTATPDAEMEFLGWTGTTASTQNPLTILAREATSLTAHFAEPMMDSDLDGVTDQNDICPETARGESVQATGCSCRQLDDDSDGVVNCDDTCPQTALAREVDIDGCACEQRDQDGDGVDDCIDTCLFTTGTDGAVDELGCGLRQRDTDGDGINDLIDECPQTPAQTAVTSVGCQPICGDDKIEADESCDPPDGINCDNSCKLLAPICGNDIIQAGEECDPPNGTNCNLVCRLVVFCGDGVVESSEECDPPNGTTCDAGCRIVVFCGDGVVEGDEECDPPNGITCDSACQSVSGAICGDGVREGAEECDPPNGTTCDDNCRSIGDAVCGNGIVEGGEDCEPPGVGNCDENCQSTDPTGCGPGSCFGVHATPGCDDQACCDIVCCVLPECCNVAWGATCAEGAAVACQTNAVCSGGSGDCQSPHGAPGCADESCCNVVCAFEPSCCFSSWGPFCVEIAAQAASNSLGCVCGN